MTTGPRAKDPGPFSDPVFGRLFAAQTASLLGTGLATVALGLLAHDLAGADAGAVLGTALTIKMLAYVGIAPVAGALADRVPRRAMLAGLDIARAGVAVALPFVTEVWHVYVLVFLLQAGSAAFTPLFQATVPEVLPDERTYTKALSYARLAYDLESLLSPLLAAALLVVLSFHDLFAGTAIGFLLSGALVLSARLPRARTAARRPIWEGILRGARIYLATPRLRGLLALTLAVAASGSMVIVNTVVLVRTEFSLGESAVALALAAFGAGSMLAALVLPPLLDHVADRTVMVTGALLSGVAMLAGPFVGGVVGLLALWFLLGLGSSVVQTPTGRLLRRSCRAEDRPLVFAGQFALSHACWLLAYPLAGLGGAAVGLDLVFVILGLVGLVAGVTATTLWPTGDTAELAHRHDDMPDDHPHLRAVPADHTGHHRHPYVIDDLHARWPRPD